MNEDYTPKNKNGYLSGDGTPEEQEIAQARKKKIEGFRLSIDDLAEEPVAFNQDETELFNRRMPGDDVVDAILNDTHSGQEEPQAITEDITSFSGEEQKQRMDKAEKEALKNYKKSVKKRK